MKMIRESHRALFRPQQGRGAVISEAWGPDGWKGYARGSSENSQAHQGRINARLQKCARRLPSASLCSPASCAVINQRVRVLRHRFLWLLVLWLPCKQVPLC